MVKLMSKLWDKIKSDFISSVKKTPKIQIITWIFQGIILTTVVLGWINYIMIPVTEEMTKYSDSTEDPNAVIILSMAGFLFLSFWFSMTWLHLTLLKYVMRLTIFIANRCGK